MRSHFVLVLLPVLETVGVLFEPGKLLCGRGPDYFAAACRWCNGSTRPFGGLCHGSNPCRTASRFPHSCKATSGKTHFVAGPVDAWSINGALATDGRPHPREPTTRQPRRERAWPSVVAATRQRSLINGSRMASLFPATEAMLAFNPVSLSDAAVYFVVVSNDLGSATSERRSGGPPPSAPIIRVNGRRRWAT